jgi:hypothetical protein
MQAVPSRRREGRATLLLLAVLVLLAAAGAWNYRRNLAAEERERAERSLSGYSVEDLEALAAAYRAEVPRLARRYEGAQAGRARPRDRGFLGEQVDEYERVRKSSEAARELGGDVSEAEAALREVEEELAQRRSEGAQTELAVFLRRLLTI